MSTTPTPTTPGSIPFATGSRRTWARGLVALGLAVFGPGLLIGCSQQGGDRPEAAAETTAPTANADEVSADASATADAPAPDAPSSDDAGAPVPTGGGQDSGGSTAPQPPAAPAPTITSFETPESIDCHNGNSQTFTLSWAVANAEKVTISIDGPGVYDTYGPSGSVSLPFDCSTSHSFLLTAHGADGQTTARSVTLEPRNVQAPDSGDEEQ